MYKIQQYLKKIVKEEIRKTRFNKLKASFIINTTIAECRRAPRLRSVRCKTAREAALNNKGLRWWLRRGMAWRLGPGVAAGSPDPRAIKKSEQAGACGGKMNPTAVENRTNKNNLQTIYFFKYWKLEI